jgi:nitroreductase
MHSMDLFTAIDSRSSALKLTEPAPTRADIERILLAGARAPDHGKLAPWRFIVLEGDARARLGEAMAETLASERSVSESALSAERAKPLRAPIIVVAVAQLTRGHKVPEHEQVHAVVAAVQNMFLAAHALGYGAMWKTGTAVTAAAVRKLLGLDDDAQIVAFLYLGTNATPGPVRAPAIAGKTRWL